MSGILSYFVEEVEVTRPGVRESRGTRIPDWDNATSFSVPGCHCQPTSSSYEDDGRVANQTDGARLYAPPGSDIRKGDRVRAIDQNWVVTVVHPTWRSPTGRLTHRQFDLERWEG